MLEVLKVEKSGMIVVQVAAYCASARCQHDPFGRRLVLSNRQTRIFIPHTPNKSRLDGKNMIRVHHRIVVWIKTYILGL